MIARTFRTARPWLAVLLGVLAAGPALPQGAQIQGKVYRRNNKPFEGVTVQLKGNQDNTIDSYVTRSDGSYVFKALPARGTVSLMFSRDKKSDDEPDYAVVLVSGLPSQTGHTINPALETLSSQALNAGNFNAVALSTREAYAVYRLAKPHAGVPRWATAGSQWLARTAQHLAASKGSEALAFRDFNHLVTSMQAVSAARSRGLGQTDLAFAALPYDSPANDSGLPQVAIWSTKGLYRFEVKGNRLTPFEEFKDLPLDPKHPPNVFKFTGNSLFASAYGSQRLNRIKLRPPLIFPKPLKIPGGKEPLAVSPDNNLVAILADGGSELQLVRLADKSIVRILPTGPAAVLVARFCPDGKSLATGTALGVLTVWDISTGKVAFRTQLEEPFITAIDFFDRGQQLVVGTGLDTSSKLLLFRKAEGTWLRAHERPMAGWTGVADLTVSPNGRKLIALPGAKGWPVIIDMRAGKLGTARPVKQPGRPVFLGGSDIGVLHRTKNGDLGLKMVK